MNWTTLVDAEDLVHHLHEPDLHIVDARFALADADAGEAAWRISRLPGAGYVHLDRDLSNHSKPGSEGRHPLPDAAAFCSTLERLGIEPESQVVVYDAGDGAMAAARFWWMLGLLGHARAAVLNGGFARWSSLGLALQSQAPVAAARSHYAAQFDRRKIAEAAEVLGRLGESGAWLLDARAAERFRGEVEPMDTVAGHIPGAVNRPFSSNLAQGRFKSAPALRAEFDTLLGGQAANGVVLTCGSGVTACHNLLAMEHAGLHGGRVFAGSWSGWISDPTRPVATGD